jgi:hypothetical protein
MFRRSHRRQLLSTLLLGLFGWLVARVRAAGQTRQPHRAQPHPAGLGCDEAASTDPLGEITTFTYDAAPQRSTPSGGPLAQSTSYTCRGGRVE